MWEKLVVGVYSIRITEHACFAKSGLKFVGENVAFFGHCLEAFGFYELFFAVFDTEEHAFNADT